MLSLDDGLEIGEHTIILAALVRLARLGGDEFAEPRLRQLAVCHTRLEQADVGAQENALHAGLAGVLDYDCAHVVVSFVSILHHIKTKE
jgi:hypothetical protein